MLLPALLAGLLMLLAPSASSPASTHAGDDVEIPAWIEAGRKLLEAGQPVAAEAQFRLAVERDGGSLGTRMWVLRAWMDQGRSDTVLSALDELERAGQRGPEMDYLFGMAFALRAEHAVASATTDSSTGLLFADAIPLLRSALATDPARYRDATLVLARAAWQAQALDDARWAADLAVETRSDWREAWLQRGRIALSQFVVAEGEDAGGARAEELWAAATESFRRALQLCEAEEDAAGAAGAATALAHALLWRARVVEATAALATSMAWAPDAHDFAATQALLATHRASDEEGPFGFRAAVESGRERFEARAGAADPRLAALDWWLGWARFLDGDFLASEAAFEASLARDPALTSAWFYVTLARAYRKEPERALAALRAGCEADRETMVATLLAARANLRGFEGLIGWCATQARPRNLDAAYLAELLTEAFPDEPRHWNNLGLFLRDEGELLEITAHREHAPPPDAELLAELYERSFAAYERALALTPDDPQVLNDTALMLQYHLGRDLEQVAAMYLRSIELSELRLAAPDLSPDDRARLEQTRSDATGNLRILRAPPPADDGAAPSATAGR